MSAIGPREVGAHGYTAADRLGALFPAIGPWTYAILFHGLIDLAPPRVSIEPELELIEAQRLAPLALEYLRHHRIELTGAVRGRLRRSDFVWTGITTAVANRAEPALTLLRANGVPHVVTKGPGVAAAYRSARLRPYSDIDVLVAPKDYLTTARLLQRAGWQPKHLVDGDWRVLDRYCREATNLERGDFESIDLHHHIPPWQWGSSLTAADLVARLVRREVGGTEMPCASFEDNFMICALHVVSDKDAPGSNLLAWRDLVELRRVCDGAHLDRLLADYRMQTWADRLLASLPDEVKTWTQPAWRPADDLQHPARLKLVLGSRLVESWPISRQFLRLPLMPNGLLYLVGILFPTRRRLVGEFGDVSTPRLYLSWWSRLAGARTSRRYRRFSEPRA